MNLATAPSIGKTPVIKSDPTGLTSEEARSRLQKSGPNAMPDTALYPFRRALTQFWTPVLPDTRTADIVLVSLAWGPNRQCADEHHQNRIDLAPASPAVRAC